MVLDICTKFVILKKAVAYVRKLLQVKSNMADARYLQFKKPLCLRTYRHAHTQRVKFCIMIQNVQIQK